jgi:hypothetical protein
LGDKKVVGVFVPFFVRRFNDADDADDDAADDAAADDDDADDAFSADDAAVFDAGAGTNRGLVVW